MADSGDVPGVPTIPGKIAISPVRHKDTGRRYVLLEVTEKGWDPILLTLENALMIADSINRATEAGVAPDGRFDLRPKPFDPSIH